jgi:hypothetical protein
VETDTNSVSSCVQATDRHEVFRGTSLGDSSSSTVTP